jgi:Niemann-Pick C1 protein
MYFPPSLASYFMTYHSILKTSEDYIGALKNARDIAANITRTLNETGHHYNVFPYRYKQYLFFLSYFSYITPSL